MKTAVLIIDASGLVRCLYSELIDLSSVGSLQIERACAIEFDHQTQQWEVHAPDGRRLYRNTSRALCLAWEVQHFNLQLTNQTPEKDYA